MNLARLVGRKLIVNYQLLHNFNCHFTRGEGRQVEMKVEGMIMESAKVFESLEAAVEGETISLTVYASLVFWNRGGSPEFEVTRVLGLAPGTYTVQYVDQDRQATVLQKSHI